jgi:hypothetical protein
MVDGRAVSGFDHPRPLARLPALLKSATTREASSLSRYKKVRRRGRGNALEVFDELSAGHALTRRRRRSEARESTLCRAGLRAAHPGHSERLPLPCCRRCCHPGHFDKTLRTPRKPHGAGLPDHRTRMRPTGFEPVTFGFVERDGGYAELCRARLQAVFAKSGLAGIGWTMWDFVPHFVPHQQIFPRRFRWLAGPVDKGGGLIEGTPTPRPVEVPEGCATRVQRQVFQGFRPPDCPRQDREAHRNLRHCFRGRRRCLRECESPPWRRALR